MNSSLLEVTKTLVFSSVLFVWVIRYNNIVEEFKSYNYPDWLRDLVGILKIFFVILMINQEPMLVRLGAIGIIGLMLAAMITHVRVKNPFPKMIPSIVLFSLSIFIFFNS